MLSKDAIINHELFQWTVNMAGHVGYHKNYIGARDMPGPEELESDSWKVFELPVNNS